MHRATGLSVRVKLTLSYAGFLMLASGVLLVAVCVFLLRYVPDVASGFAPNYELMIRGDALVVLRVLWGAFGQAAASVMIFLLPTKAPLPKNTSTCRSSRKKPLKRCYRSRKSMASASKPAAT